MFLPVLVKTSGASSNCKCDSHLHIRLQTCMRECGENIRLLFIGSRDRTPPRKLPYSKTTLLYSLTLLWAQNDHDSLLVTTQENWVESCPWLKSEKRKEFFLIMMSLSCSIHTPLAQFCHCFTLCLAPGPFFGDEKEICSADWKLVHYLAALIAELKCILLFILSG